jgi:hypothetical protein
LVLNMHILCPTFGYCTNHPKELASILCVLHNLFNKTNVYFVNIMQLFHIELYVFEVLLMQ